METFLGVFIYCFRMWKPEDLIYKIERLKILSYAAGDILQWRIFNTLYHSALRSCILWCAWASIKEKFCPIGDGSISKHVVLIMQIIIHIIINIDDIMQESPSGGLILNLNQRKFPKQEY